MRKPRGPDVDRARPIVAGLLALAALTIGAIALLGGSSAGGTAGGAPILSLPQLLAEASRRSAPIYWVGPRAGGERYELSPAPGGGTYVRYLAGGAEAGDPRLLTVGTYPVPDAPQALAAAGRASAGSQTLSRHEGYELLGSAGATSAYVVFDDQPRIQIEIYSPERGEAARLAATGALRPVG